ncbi:hypothetical protein [Alicyclobacillus acidoterrestris]|uniref:Uncharacterized protein n=1 Tax=Alicyclobacillus acidoterrestris (strain ATCC 49025 / DSM 3922 / CIP 106132 / NCIMB 13137 / GD3B) TaxID=1356854 RepID=T0C3V7_ALIAG|nr:hypothetical protein [Alicyclobacillus acidoterrestris]EPZ47684.1 hypothetical protein N007_05365 [Alicyclobacillus acidoterrestris ATCC 49025]UNO47997.1 hypothetical protein K1I37_15085 [Alicyclobacillus acidoterrestris]
MERTVIDAINAYPCHAQEALANVYRSKVFVVSMANGAIVKFAKTRRGAEGYVKRHSTAYYDEYTQSMVSTSYDITEVAASEIVDPTTSISVWYNWLKDVNGHDYMYNNVLATAKHIGVSEAVMAYVANTINEMKRGEWLTVIDAYESALVVEKPSLDVAEVTAPTHDVTYTPVSNVIDFTARKRQREQDAEHNAYIDYFINVILPKLDFNDLQRLIASDGDMGNELMRIMLAKSLEEMRR